MLTGVEALQLTYPARQRQRVRLAPSILAGNANEVVSPRVGGGRPFKEHPFPSTC